MAAAPLVHLVDSPGQIGVTSDQFTNIQLADAIGCGQLPVPPAVMLRAPGSK